MVKIVLREGKRFCFVFQFFFFFLSSYLSFLSLYSQFLSLTPLHLNQVPNRVRCKFLDIIAHCLSAAMFLGLDDAKTSFAKLLLKTVRLEKNRAGGKNGMFEESMILEQEKNKDDDDDDDDNRESGEIPVWYTALLNAGSVEEIHNVIAELMMIIKSIKELMMTKHANRRLRKIASMFSSANQESLIVKENRQFLKRGELIKISTRQSGRKYMFFLFNDMLIYASTVFSFKKSEERQYKIHRQMNFKDGIKFIDLKATKWEGKSGFIVVHPSKTFRVYAETDLQKRQWLAALKSAKGVYYNSSAFSPSATMAMFSKTGSAGTSGRKGDDSSERTSSADESGLS